MNEPELYFRENFLENPNELLDFFREGVDWDERMKARKTASFGISYDYSGITYSQKEMLPELVPICERIQQEIGFLPNNCLMNYYPDGHSTMGFHSDSTDELMEDTGVVIVSLGSSRYISFRSKLDSKIKFKYLLNSGGLLYMQNEIQAQWMHAIPKDPAASERISLTFRWIIK
ncbi:alpha-ketoglutarate-dependent dioxygenase AlkB [Gimesia aquarii]|uniref:2OG-Fe(II) oxygenase superfamily protein n=1 Tax=Gimesia aquarii TaxID=2527964 RepID=A0A517WQ06_9PLAN|nr:alpha-ketoglutarate-dependent dioxygenase AlkB [Gimesia aquarii]QDU07349.1 2OG-Fe(II) oxygenase superfamily protein [Gimesia aquarii]